MGVEEGGERVERGGANGWGVEWAGRGGRLGVSVLSEVDRWYGAMGRLAI